MKKFILVLLLSFISIVNINAMEYEKEFKETYDLNDKVEIELEDLDSEYDNYSIIHGNLKVEKNGNIGFEGEFFSGARSLHCWIELVFLNSDKEEIFRIKNEKYFSYKILLFDNYIRKNININDLRYYEIIIKYNPKSFSDSIYKNKDYIVSKDKIYGNINKKDVIEVREELDIILNKDIDKIVRYVPKNNYYDNLFFSCSITDAKGFDLEEEEDNYKFVFDIKKLKKDNKVKLNISYNYYSENISDTIYFRPLINNDTYYDIFTISIDDKLKTDVNDSFYFTTAKYDKEMESVYLYKDKEFSLGSNTDDLTLNPNEDVFVVIDEYLPKEIVSNNIVNDGLTNKERVIFGNVGFILLAFVIVLLVCSILFFIYKLFVRDKNQV